MCSSSGDITAQFSSSHAYSGGIPLGNIRAAPENPSSSSMAPELSGYRRGCCAGVVLLRATVLCLVLQKRNVVSAFL